MASAKYKSFCIVYNFQLWRPIGDPTKIMNYQKKFHHKCNPLAKWPIVLVNHFHLVCGHVKSSTIQRKLEWQTWIRNTKYYNMKLDNNSSYIQLLFIFLSICCITLENEIYVCIIFKCMYLTFSLDLSFWFYFFRIKCCRICAFYFIFNLVFQYEFL